MAADYSTARAPANRSSRLPTTPADAAMAANYWVQLGDHPVYSRRQKSTMKERAGQSVGDAQAKRRTDAQVRQTGTPSAARCASGWAIGRRGPGRGWPPGSLQGWPQGWPM